MRGSPQGRLQLRRRTEKVQAVFQYRRRVPVLHDAAHETYVYNVVRAAVFFSGRLHGVRDAQRDVGCESMRSWELVGRDVEAVQRGAGGEALGKVEEPYARYHGAVKLGLQERIEAGYESCLRRKGWSRGQGLGPGLNIRGKNLVATRCLWQCPQSGGSRGRQVSWDVGSSRGSLAICSAVD